MKQTLFEGRHDKDRNFFCRDVKIAPAVTGLRPLTDDSATLLQSAGGKFGWIFQFLATWGESRLASFSSKGLDACLSETPKLLRTTNLIQTNDRAALKTPIATREFTSFETLRVCSVESFSAFWRLRVSHFADTCCSEP